MSGAFVSTGALTGGPGYKANAAYDDFLRKHSSFYRRHSAVGREMEEDRRRSSAAMDASAVQQATKNVAAETGARRSSVVNAVGGAALANSRKGSVAVVSDVDRRDSVFGLEASGGVRADEGRRPSTSLASDLYHKMKGGQNT